MPGNASGEKRHALATGGIPTQRSEFECPEVRRGQQLLPDGLAAKCRICTEIGGSAIVVQEADQAKVFDATTLAGGCRKDHDLREIVAAIALDPNARVRPVLAGDVFRLQHERHGARRIDCYGSVRGAKPGAKGDGGDMPLAHASQGKNESERVFRYSRLIRMQDDARIEKRCCLIGIFVAKMGTDQERLFMGDLAITDDDAINLVEPPQKQGRNLTMPSREIIKNALQLLVERCWVERQDAVGDALRTWLIRYRIFIGFRRRHIGSDHYPCWIGAEQFG